MKSGIISRNGNKGDSTPFGLAQFRSVLQSLFEFMRFSPPTPTHIQNWIKKQWRKQWQLWRPDDSEQFPPDDKIEIFWSALRIKAAEEIWGIGRLGPEPKNFIQEWVQPLDLNSGKKLLELGCQLGTISRDCTRFWGSRATAMETDPYLALEARERAITIDPNDHVMVIQLDPNLPLIPPDAYDAAICRDQIASAKRKAHLLDMLWGALRENGQCLFIETVLRTENPPDQRAQELLEAWSKLEPTHPKPISLNHITNDLIEAGFKLRLVEDVTEHYTNEIAEIFAALPRRLKQTNIPLDLHPLVMREVERIGAKAKALESAGLAIYRFYTEI
ncbi:MAG: methyltransferase domain-containing protein [Alphaproteobacteria bacterium]|nr:methyltransferase domain-containing protein [Alphaproteobacteria bacterium]